MRIVTVVSSSGMRVQVTIDGPRMETFASAYAKRIIGVANDGKLQSIDLVEGSNTAPSSTADVTQSVVTIGGAFAMNGSYTNLLIGSENAGDGAINPFGGPVTVNGSGITASSLSVLTGNIVSTSFDADNYNGTFVSTTGNNLFNGAGHAGN